MGGVFDWVLWIGGGLVVAGGLVLGGWALFWDRPRGRRRCAKCWYDMAATPGLVCSECGYTAKREKKLKKTRRHLWWARLAVMLVLFGSAGLTWSRARQGPQEIVPTTALIILMPEMKDWWPEGHTELIDRLRDGRPWSWQWRWLISRCYGGEKTFCQVDIETAQRWPEGVELVGAVSGEIDSAFYPSVQWRRGLRARIEPRFDCEAKPAYVHSLALVSQAPFSLYGGSPGEHRPWWHQATPLGMPPGPGTLNLEFEVIVERNRWRKGAPLPVEGDWQVIHKERVTISLEVTGALEDYIRPDDSEELGRWLRDNVGLLLGNRALRVIPPIDVPPSEDLTLPVTIELFRDGEPITSWPDWWETDKSGVWLGKQHVIKVGITGSRRPFGKADYARYSWSVRVSGDPRRAVPHEKADRFWSGSYEVPLVLVDEPHELLYRSPG